MLKLYNTLSGKKEEFAPKNPKRVGMYVCGPTVYGPGHIGHARTYIAFDIIRRYLEYRGFRVKFVMNITDIHDDIIKEANRQNIGFLILANKFADLFLREQRMLGIKRADVYPRVTSHIPEIVKFIQNLVKKGYAYEEQSSVYFDVSKFKDYGKLSGIRVKKEITGKRIKTDKYEREEAADFSLWKAKKTGEPSWSSPWGKGRPGWHIECSVMSQKYLGKQFDIHGGAKDLIFPHHENEIAQSEAGGSKKPFVKYWLHSGLLTINGQKMSKSLGNYIEINQALKKWPARIIRLFICSGHWRSAIDWNENGLLQAKKNLARIEEFVDKIRSPKYKLRNKSEIQISKFKTDFEKAMDDDFNTPKALAVVFELIKRGNALMDQGLFGKKDGEKTLELLKKFDKVFNFIFWERRVGSEKIPAFVKKLVLARQAARRKKDWKKADWLREKIQKFGYQVEDTKTGPKLKKI
jgi:cysteinyl-tRNA synthetase